MQLKIAWYGVQVSIVVKVSNFWRGKYGSKMEATADVWDTCYDNEWYLALQRCNWGKVEFLQEFNGNWNGINSRAFW